ncbi:hypothetical protein [Streptomyces sp. CAU 1734]|uniref:hypothetical protein n=1 Tax=Streptomyces sp. CAU 1734 TaxID=3140360 RepID=UPI003260CC60
MTAPVRPRDHAPASPPRAGRLRRALAGPLLTHYHRLAALVIAANLAFLAAGTSGGDSLSAAELSDAALINVALAVVVRQQYVINALFRLATSAPTSWPLGVRRILAKVYHFGGLHVGGATAGTLWFLALIGAMTLRGAPAPVLAVAYTLGVLLIAIIATALPAFRARFHDHFERIHRYGGWAALLLLWTQTLLVAHEERQSPLTSSAVHLLALITFSVALPWFRLRRIAVTAERPSTHVALARFDYGVTPFAGSSTAISRSPLGQWHSFANVPEPGRSGYRLTISRAGDWTGEFIDDLPTEVWTKGITTAGVANVETLFTRVVYVATGSGIGPCLPHLLAREVPALLVWATRAPRTTYGDALVDEILAVQPEARIWDTAEHGKPDMLALALAAHRDFGAEAVICISNKKLTWHVVQGLESRGIPAYGAIWDS